MKKWAPLPHHVIVIMFIGLGLELLANVLAIKHLSSPIRS